MTNKRPRGMGEIRRRPGCAPAIRYYQPNGKPKQESVAKALTALGKRKRPDQITDADCEWLLRKRLGEIEAGVFIAPALARMRMAELFEAKRANLRLRAALGEIKRLDTALSALARLERAFGTVRISALTDTLVTQWKTRELEAGAARGTIATLTNWLRAVFAHARNTNLIRVAPHIEPIRHVNNARQGFLTLEQTRALQAHAPLPVIADVLEFARLCGWRRNEIFGLTWETVHREDGELRIPTSKNGHPRVIPLVGQLATLIDQRWRARALGCPYVFHRHGQQWRASTWNRYFKMAREAAGLPGVWLHDFRRTAYRRLRRARADLTIVMDIAGHRSVSMARRYAITDVDLMGQALLDADALDNAGDSRAVRSVTP